MQMISLFIKKILIVLVRVYQKGISPALGPHCRFYPSCSEYCILAIRKHGPLRGVLKSLKRICRCNPFHSGGVDFP